MDSERNSDLATLPVEYRYINSNSIGNEGRFEECITVRFRLVDTILKFMLHLFTSFNGLQKSNMAKPLQLIKGKTLHLRRGKRERRLDDDHKDSSLTDFVELSMGTVWSFEVFHHSARKPIISL